MNLNNHSHIAAESNLGGDAGSLTIRADNLTLNNSEATVASRIRRGEAGDLTVHARSIALRNGAQIRATNNNAPRPREGDRGSNIRLVGLDNQHPLRTVDVTGSRSQISASTQRGQGGSVIIAARDAVNVNNYGHIAAESNQGGDAGSLTIRTDDLTLNNNARATVASQRGTGEAGNLTVRARSISVNDHSQIQATNDATPIPKDNATPIQGRRDRDGDAIPISGESDQGGNIRLRGLAQQPLESLQVTNHSRVTASTARGQGGSVAIGRSEGIEVRNQSDLAVEATGTGNAGNLTLRPTDQLTIRNGSSATVSSERGEAGNLRIDNAGLIVLDDGDLRALAGKGSGGNIDVTTSAQIFRLLHGSNIIAQASSSADGGNVFLKVPDGFVIANPFENSDINATAQGVGNGGNINITTYAIFGLQQRDALTPLSDIVASSRFGTNGTIVLNTLGIDPSRGLASLPTNVLAANQISSACAAGNGTRRAQGEFVISGRGNLPPSPIDPLSGNDFLTGWASLDPNPSTATTPPIPEPATSDKLIEAQGWVIGAHGEVIFQADAANPTSQPAPAAPTHCP